MSEQPLGDFGAWYRRAVFAGDPDHKGTVRLAWYLVDLAYIRGTLTLRVGERQILDELRLFRSALVEARDELVRLGLLEYAPRPGGRSGSRSEYTLTLPQEVRGSTGALHGDATAPPQPRTSDQRPAQRSARESARGTAPFHRRTGPSPSSSPPKPSPSCPICDIKLPVTASVADHIERQHSEHTERPAAAPDETSPPTRAPARGAQSGPGELLEELEAGASGEAGS